MKKDQGKSMPLHSDQGDAKAAEVKTGSKGMDQGDACCSPSEFPAKSRTQDKGAYNKGAALPTRGPFDSKGHPASMPDSGEKKSEMMPMKRRGVRNRK